MLVLITPGHTMLHRMPLCKYAQAVCSQRPTRPCFATVYATLERPLLSPATDAIVTILPPSGCSIIFSTAALIAYIGPVRSTAMILSQSSFLTSVTGSLLPAIPALLTRISILPVASIAFSIIFSLVSCVEISPTNGMNLLTNSSSYSDFNSS